ncbi:RNA polymerase subunit sigma-70 [Caulobacter vibrioides]|uniref:RNA polymerase subunit sigma-70 n=1 Tax=Caulobacter vibrioides TaxID=155892 RepID=A0A290MMY1_CAUVI|nr:sigma-70 family RNA polymerase sigma factor [Caulobacter vibrioides]ATC33135.1 RNA polymerase subunit sigma-70 [Caulobacter vibrioides]
MTDSETRLKALMLRGLDGDTAAYRECLALLGVRLRAYFMRRMSGAPGDVEDLVQETLLAVHLKRSTWDSAQSFTAWAHAVARYKLIDHWRRRKIRQTLPIEDHIEFLAADEPDPGVAMELDRALATLPERQRLLVSDVKLTGLSLAEAGARAGISEGAAKVALHRALKALAERMRRADG